MKRITVAIVIGLVLMCFASPVLAQSPPDIQVSVDVVTPGDVDLDVGITAGGNVNVTVGGIDMQQTSSWAQSAYNHSQSPTNYLWDYGYYWGLSGIGGRIEGQIAELRQLIDLLANSQVKLITASDQSGAVATALASRVQLLRRDLGASMSELQAGIAQLQEQDAVTWNQLIYGAEAHIAILDTRLAEQTQAIDEQAQRIKSLEAGLEVANVNNASLTSYVDYLSLQYLYYFWILAGVSLVLAVMVCLLLVKRR